MTKRYRKFKLPFMKGLFKIFLKFMLLSCLSSAFFASCATTGSSAEKQTPAVYVTNLRKVNILTTDKIENPVDEVQLFQGSFADNVFSVPLYIQADKDGLNISILNDFGTSLGELSYNGTSVHFDSALFPENIKAEYIVWDFQLAYYRPEEISQLLSKHKLSFSVEKDEASEVRIIMDDHSVIESVLIKKNFIEIKNFLRGYEYTLTGAGDE